MSVTSTTLAARMQRNKSPSLMSLALRLSRRTKLKRCLNLIKYQTSHSPKLNPREMMSLRSGRKVSQPAHAKWRRSPNIQRNQISKSSLKSS